MTARLLPLLLVSIGFVTLPAPTQADAPDCRTVTTTIVVQGNLQTRSDRVCSGTREAQDGEDATAPTVPTVGHRACLGIVSVLSTVRDDDYCNPQAPRLRITPEMVASALRRVPLPASTLRVQPGNGRTLVNFDTNFFTDGDGLTRTVRLLGQRVDLRITPARFTWNFGDGASSTTAEPGAAYPALDITHRYRSTGAVAPSVDTTYTADFRVGGGGWQPVPGSVTVPGATVDLDVVEAAPLLVGHE